MIFTSALGGLIVSQVRANRTPAGNWACSLGSRFAGISSELIISLLPVHREYTSLLAVGIGALYTIAGARVSLACSAIALERTLLVRTVGALVGVHCPYKFAA